MKGERTRRLLIMGLCAKCCSGHRTNFIVLLNICSKSILLHSLQFFGLHRTSRTVFKQTQTAPGGKRSRIQLYSPYFPPPLKWGKPFQRWKKKGTLGKKTEEETLSQDVQMCRRCRVHWTDHEKHHNLQIAMTNVLIRWWNNCPGSAVLL